MKPSALLLVLALSGCGGGDSGDVAPDGGVGGGGAADGAAGSDGAPPTEADGGPLADGGGTAPIDGGEAAPGVDCFGTDALYATAPGGREWCLPEDATVADDEWQPDGIEATDEPGVFRSFGSPRHSVGSPEGMAWWRNVEMTAYLRLVEGNDEYTLYARGERHTRGDVAPDEINEGVAAPAGTATWPGYPFDGPVTHECLGTAYKGSLASSGEVFYKKEISHTGGYTDADGEAQVFEGGLPVGEWVGLKVVIRNVDGDAAVRLETWVDREADGSWEMVTSLEDRGGWEGDPASDGCDDAPFSYTQDQILTWAGPIAVLRADDTTFDFSRFTIREIAPLP